MTFALTKIQPPRPRPGFVLRQATRERLARALAARRLVTVAAPAGYGKTALLAHELARLPAGSAVAWISADEGDDLPQLLECMLAALEPQDPPWRVAPEALVQRAGQGSADECRAVAAEIINALDACEVARGLVVFDDLHRVHDRAFFQFLEMLVERVGERWGLVLASRSDLPLALGRIRAAGDLAEFGQLDLQLAREEARRLAAAEGIDAATADRMFDRTHGWAAGLRLAIGAMGAAGAASPARIESALRAGERPMIDFLASEVLDPLRPELADFLMRVSVLHELEAGRCAMVSGNPRAAALLDEVEEGGLFVDVLDAPSRTLRLHDIFREALLARLRDREPALLAELRRRAAQGEPDLARRVALLLEAGDVPQAAREVYTHGPAAIALSGPAGATALLRAFPPGERDRHPELAFVRGQVAWVHWDFAAMRSECERAAAGFRARGDEPDAQLADAYRAYALVALGALAEAGQVLSRLQGPQLRQDVAIIALNARASLALDTGQLQSIAPLLAEMLDRLERADRIELWHNTTPLNRIAGVPGIGPVLARHAQLMLRVGGEAPTQMRPLALLSQAWDAALRGDRAEAESLVTRTRREADWSGSTGAVHGTLLRLQAVLHAMAGEAAEAVAVARQRARELPQLHFTWGHYLMSSFNARIAAAAGDVEALREFLRIVAAAHPGPTAFADAPAAFALRGTLAWHESQPAEACRLWRAALAHADEIDYLDQAAETHLRLAQALLRDANADEAAAQVRLALGRVRREGRPGGALLARAAIQELARHAWGDLLAREEVEQLRAWTRLPVAAPGKAAAGPETLSARELEVLRHIAAGDSNKVIARALDLSLHTVKRHVANILAKVGAETRGQAAAWLREKAPG